MLAEVPLAGLSLKIGTFRDRKLELAESIVRADGSIVSSLTAEDVEMRLSCPDHPPACGAPTSPRHVYAVMNHLHATP
jgi:hypothetical protein